MRYLFLILITFIIFCSCNNGTKPQQAQAAVKDTIMPTTPPPVESKPKDTLVLNKTLENIYYDLNKDGQADMIRLSQDTAGKNLKWFNRITLSISGQPDQSYKNEDAWGKVDTFFLKKNKNEILSNWIHVYKDSTQIIVLLFGLTYGFDSGKSSVLQVKNGNIKMIFNKEWDYISELADLDDDGIVEIVCKSHSEVYESKGIQVETYDPYYVYSLNGSNKWNMPLTKKHNEEHYVWAGLKAPEKIKVFYPMGGGKPKILK